MKAVVQAVDEEEHSTKLLYYSPRKFSASKPPEKAGFLKRLLSVLAQIPLVFYEEIL